MSDDLQHRLDELMRRLRTSYDGIGHSTGRPYVYFVYPAEQERALQRMVDEQLLFFRLYFWFVSLAFLKGCGA